MEKNRTFKKYVGSEDDFQESVARYLNLLNLRWCHVPNGGLRGYKTAAKLKRQGTKPGVPDVVIFEPRGRFHGLMIELKVSDNKPTTNQVDWLNGLSAKGYAVFWTNSFDEVKHVVEQYLSL